ncbi:ribonuclease T2-like protein [Blyttiomyces helicus]|uniref:ribonuclease T2 n=1 Tax=Blyttiomyces helicus TaxID=388810 RepID=A0A4P9W8X5_9FUNG|nr:ribonuclease T2-like protein [Blyttiomyces helicus]|eukprot:RKO88592.1 ribonuclease T2-like protein [Blyttiomyces helicus]
MHVARATLIAGFAAAASAVPSNPFLSPRALTCPVSEVSCSGGSTDSCCVPDNGILVLSVQWLTGYCASNSCNISPPNFWTIHGLWPDNCNGEQVGNCDKSRQYSDVAERLQAFDPSLFNTLQPVWPSFKGSDMSSYDAFWSHEWQKHGTCYSPATPSVISRMFCFHNAREGQDVATFMSYTYELYRTYSLDTALANAGITPGGSYALTDIDNAITSAYPNIQASYTCTQDGNLSEVHLGLFATPKGALTGPSTGDSNTCSGNVNY